jgi:hypothetical protein
MQIVKGLKSCFNLINIIIFSFHQFIQSHMKQIYLPLAVILISSAATAQSPKRAIKKLGNEPAFFIDSISVSKDDLQKYDPNQIAAVSVYKDKTAIELLGEEGKDGAVYIETKAFAKKKYWSYFKSKSEAYATAVPDAAGDSTVQYILNGKLLKENYEGDLSSINDTIFKSISIISKEELEKQHGVKNKRLGVLIHSEVPDNLYKGKKKFNN